MDAQKIEKLDKARYNAWLVQTIGFALMVGILILHFATGNESTGLFITEAVAMLVFLIGAFWKMNVFRKIRSDEKIRKALNNELYVQYGYKTYFWGFWALLISLLILIYVKLDTTLTCLVALFAGALTQQIATLIYYRRDGKE
jgi:hypothetical protein